VSDACDPWPITWPCDTAAVDPELVVEAGHLAGLMLWGLSGRRFGVCDHVESYYPPCTAECGAPYKGPDGEWRNRVSAASNCCRILLRNAPVVSVESVTIWGELVDPAGYDVSARRYLRRRSACWPCEDQCDDPPIEVAYRAGWGYPAGTAAVVGEVACELLAGLQGNPCKLPSRAVSVARQGVTVTLADPEVYLDNGLLGLPLADAWIKAVNPNGMLTVSRVYSPDLARRARVTPAPAPVLLRQVVVRNAVAAGWVGAWGAYTVEGGAKGTDVPVTAVPAGADVHLTLRLPLAGVEWVVTHDGQIITGGAA
jgi:hypothetical protein